MESSPNYELKRQARILLFQKRDVEVTAKILSYSPKKFSRLYGIWFGITPEQELSNTSGENRANHHGYDYNHGSRSGHSSIREERGRRREVTHINFRDSFTRT